MTDSWWRKRQTWTQSRQGWWRRRPRPPGLALRRTIAPPVVGTVGSLQTQPFVYEEVRWLLRSVPPPAVDSTVVNVMPHRYTDEPLDPDPLPRATGSMRTGNPPLDASPIARSEPSLAERLRLVLSVPLDALLPGPNTVIEWPAQLLAYQVIGVEALLSRDRILLADDMGLGKTVQAAAALRILCLQGKLQGALLVVPASLLDQWRRELRRWAPELRVVVVRGSSTDRSWQWQGAAHVKVVSYETLRADNELSIGWARQHHWDLVILDEAQKIKNPDSSAALVCKLLPRRRSWAMTGTPLENKLEDLASILEFVDHSANGELVHYRAGPEMLEHHRQLQLRRRKADVLTDLPPKRVIRLTLPLLPEQQLAYDRAEQDGVLQLRAKGSEVRIQHVLELILRLKQLCNFCPATGRSAKMLDIRERLEVLGQEGHRALVFSQFTDDTFGVRAAARELADFDPLVYTGDLSGPERDRIVQTFKTTPNHRALVLSLRAGGVGINLQEASYVFHLDRWWNPAIERQAEDRSHRMGQPYPVTVFTYTSDGTIEQRIDEIISAKQALFDEVVDDVSIDLGARLNAAELFGLFGLPAPTTFTGASRTSSTGLELEDRCARVLSAAGWDVQHTPRTRDGGVDLVAERIDEMGLAERLFVQCKDHRRPVGVETVRELLGVLPPGEHIRAVLVAPGGVTADARRLANAREVVIWDDDCLADLESRII